MEIHGYDFTSAPKRSKPITQAVCDLSDGVLSIHELRRHASFDTFAMALASSGPWVAAIDFPFGQPRKLIENLSWPRTWDGYVREVETIGPDGFVNAVTTYTQCREKGDREHRRACDIAARSISPMKLNFTPVGRMFMRGAPLLRRSPVSILPFRFNDRERIIVEGYPALVARRFINRRSYKHDDKKKHTDAHTAARSDLVTALRSDELRECYGVRLEFPGRLASNLVADRTADELDAVLCAIQAAWAYGQRQHGYGIPPAADRLEGWIVDPQLA